MIAEATQYVTDRKTVRREPVYSANRFSRLVRDIPIAEITSSDLDRYRKACVQNGLSSKTIESSVNDIMCIYRHVTGKPLPAGERIKCQRSKPTPASLPAICGVWKHADRWLQQWIVLTYWTCLRLSDAMLLQKTTTGPCEVLRFRASKTEHELAWPVPEWLKEWLEPVALPYPSIGDYARKTVRKAIVRCCDRAGVEHFLPKHIRQRGLTEWMRADATACGLVHGKGLGVLDHYVDPVTVIEPHAGKVRLPDVFGANENETEDISVPFSRLDPDAQRLVRDTIRRLA